MSTTLGIKLDDEIRNRLKALGVKRDRSPHWLMKAAIEDYLQREERYEVEKAEDMARYEQYLSTGKVVNSETVDKWLDDLSKGKVSKCPK